VEWMKAERFKTYALGSLEAGDYDLACFLA
jgi:HEPN domain-containing protein